MGPVQQNLTFMMGHLANTRIVLQPHALLSFFFFLTDNETTIIFFYLFQKNIDSKDNHNMITNYTHNSVKLQPTHIHITCKYIMLDNVFYDKKIYNKDWLIQNYILSNLLSRGGLICITYYMKEQEN